MSESPCAAAQAPARGFLRILMLGGLLVAGAMAAQNATDQALHRTAAHPQRPLLARMAATPQPVTPSAFAEESTMTPRQLLDRWDSHVTEASRRFKVPKTWIRAVMARESGGRTMLGEGQPIVSRAGAIGLMQVMPDTYAEMRAEHGLGDNPFDARDNVLAGTAYLRWLHKRYGYPQMFAAYNAGPGRVDTHRATGGRLPAETRAYVGGITRALNPGGPHLADAGDTIRLTRPDGGTVTIDVGQVTGIRAAMPGEFAPGVQTVVTLGKKSQGIRESVTVATAAIQAGGG
ncbi:MAG TPA: lytic transglycosylase domain-containing protein [Rhizomicrobium sp.]|nr:lytic transglycosylase domain-containing protein [Rhizomicrobium sp.]